MQEEHLKIDSIGVSISLERIYDRKIAAERSPDTG